MLCLPVLAHMHSPLDPRTRHSHGLTSKLATAAPIPEVHAIRGAPSLQANCVQKCTFQVEATSVAQCRCTDSPWCCSHTPHTPHAPDKTRGAPASTRNGGTADCRRCAHLLHSGRRRRRPEEAAAAACVMDAWRGGGKAETAQAVDN